MTQSGETQTIAYRYRDSALATFALGLLVAFLSFGAAVAAVGLVLSSYEGKVTPKPRPTVTQTVIQTEPQ